MHTFLLYGFAALGIVAFLVSLVATLVAYPSLPARVPFGFDNAGRPIAFGPRPAALVFLGAQAFALACEAMAVAHARSGFESQPWVAAIALSSATAIFTVMQLRVLAIAVGRTRRLGNMPAFAGSFVGVVVLALAAGRLSP